MNLNAEDLHYAAMCAEVHSHPELKLIRVTTGFAAYIGSLHRDEMKYKVSDVPNGIYGHWTGIPIVTDDTIKHPYYELEFEA